MIAVSTVWWVPLLGVSLLLVLVAAVLISGIARGRITMELGWGRSRMSLRDRRVEIASPPEVVLDLLRQAARGEVPGVTKRERTEVIEGLGDDAALAGAPAWREIALGEVGARA